MNLWRRRDHPRVERFGRIGGTDLTHAKPYEPNVRVYEEEEYIVSKTINVWVAQKEKLFGPCNEQFPFEFQLPEGALPSITTQSENKTGIIYEIKAKIDRPRSIDPKTYCEVKVEQPGYETYPTAPIERFREDFDGMLKVIAHVDKDVFVPGEHVRECGLQARFVAASAKRGY